MINNEEIIEDNLIISKFLGMTGTDQFLKLNYVFHTSWSLLMPVVHKIGDIQNQADIEFASDLNRFYDTEEVTIFSVSIFAPIDLVHKCAVDFIKWYNITILK